MPEVNRVHPTGQFKRAIGIKKLSTSPSRGRVCLAKIWALSTVSQQTCMVSPPNTRRWLLGRTSRTRGRSRRVKLLNTDYRPFYTTRAPSGRRQRYVEHHHQQTGRTQTPGSSCSLQRLTLPPSGSQRREGVRSGRRCRWCSEETR